MQAFVKASEKPPVYLIYGNAEQFEAPLNIPENALEGAFEPYHGDTVARIQSCSSFHGLQVAIQERLALGLTVHVVHNGADDVIKPRSPLPQDIVTHDWKALDEASRTALLAEMGTAVDYSNIAPKAAPPQKLDIA